MSLIQGKSALKASLLKLYLDTAGEKSVQTFAKRKAEAINTFVLTAQPKTIITFANPATGTGIGGIDLPVPGMTLVAAKILLELQFLAIWSHGGAVKPPSVQADLMSTAIFSYFSQAMVSTIDLGPLDPVPISPTFLSGASTGIGGVLTPAPGSGYSSAKPILEKELSRIWSQVANVSPRAVPQFAKDMADAIHNFCKEGKVSTTGVVIHGAGLSVSSSIS